MLPCVCARVCAYTHIDQCVARSPRHGTASGKATKLVLLCVLVHAYLSRCYGCWPRRPRGRASSRRCCRCWASSRRASCCRVRDCATTWPRANQSSLNTAPLARQHEINHPTPAVLLLLLLSFRSTREQHGEVSQIGRDLRRSTRGRTRASGTGLERRRIGQQRTDTTDSAESALCTVLKTRPVPESRPSLPPNAPVSDAHLDSVQFCVAPHCCDVV